MLIVEGKCAKRNKKVRKEVDATKGEIFRNPMNYGFRKVYSVS